MFWSIYIIQYVYVCLYVCLHDVDIGENVEIMLYAYTCHCLVSPNGMFLTSIRSSNAGNITYNMKTLSDEFQRELHYKICIV
jgi:hypothetical protein